MKSISVLAKSPTMRISESATADDGWACDDDGGVNAPGFAALADTVAGGALEAWPACCMGLATGGGAAGGDSCGCAEPCALSWMALATGGGADNVANACGAATDTDCSGFAALIGADDVADACGAAPDSDCSGFAALSGADDVADACGAALGCDCSDFAALAGIVSDAVVEPCPLSWLGPAGAGCCGSTFACPGFSALACVASGARLHRHSAWAP